MQVKLISNDSLTDAKGRFTLRNLPLEKNCSISSIETKIKKAGRSFFDPQAFHVTHYLPQRLHTLIALPLASILFHNNFTPVLLQIGQVPLQPAVALMFLPLFVLGIRSTSSHVDFVVFKR